MVRPILLLLFCLVLPSPLSGAEVPELSFTRYRLDNGLTVILHQDRRVPLVAVDMWYHVGAGHEVPGKSGFAHLFEHLLFRGSKHIGVDNLDEVLASIGASYVNGSTSNDRTNYFELVPSHYLNTALWIESERMGYFLPVLNQKMLETEIEVVRNERRQRTDNRPYGKTSIILAEMLYPEGHPYRGRIIGSHEDLVRASLDDVRQFHHTYYGPANATLALAGDFDIKAAKQAIEKWFGDLKGKQPPPFKKIPAPTVKRDRKVVLDSFAKLRRLSYAWHSPAAYEPGDSALEVAATILGGETGRLHQSLVRKHQLAQSVSVYQWGSQHSGSFYINVDLRPDADIKKVEKILEAEIKRFTTQPPTTNELQRAKVGAESGYIWTLEGLLYRAEILHTFNHFKDDPGYYKTYLKEIRALTGSTVQNAAAKYLKRNQRIEVLTLPVKQSSH